MRIAEARASILRAVQPLDVEPVPVAEALDRVLAEDIAADHDVPPFANSAMDGFAIHAGPRDRQLRIVAESRAGAPSDAVVGPDEACRISTGAVVPPGATAVVRVEDTEEADGVVHVLTEVAVGNNIRGPGEDLRAGSPVLAAGTRLGPAELGVAVSAGRGELLCAWRPRVSVLVTGDELVAAGSPLEPGQIHDSNGVTLGALVQRTGAELIAARHVGDDAAATREALAQALEESDVTVASGGVSVGPHDHVKPVLRELGVEELFWGVALKPGKPTWCGTRGPRLAFGLPGNPVSAMVTFVLFVRPALRALQSERGADRVGTALLGEAVRRSPDREQAIRVRLEPGPGGVRALPTGPQGSHVLSSMLGAHALALIPTGDGELPVGTQVTLEQL